MKDVTYRVGTTTHCDHLVKWERAPLESEIRKHIYSRFHFAFHHEVCKHTRFIVVGSIVACPKTLLDGMSLMKYAVDISISP